MEDFAAFLDAWKAVVNSTSVTMFDEKWNILTDKYDPLVPGLVQYIMDIWLKEWKHLVVQVWTDLHLHIGNRTTSRVEGAHNTLKKYLQVSTGDLKAVFDKIVILLTTQYIEFDGGVAQQQIKTPHSA